MRATTVALLLIASLSFGVDGCIPKLRADEAPSIEHKVVAVGNNPPFVIRNNGEKPYGFDIDLAEIFAKENGWQITFVTKSNVLSVIDAVQSGEADFGLSGITINSKREKIIDFTQPYFTEGGIQMLTHADNCSLSFTEKLVVAFPTLKKMFALMFWVVTIIAHAIYFKEGFNGDDKQFHRNYFIGIFEAYYWAIVTCSTVGFGDLTPKTVVGRIITIFAIIFGLFWFADFMSDMAVVKQILTNQKNNIVIEQLNGEIIATKEGSTANEFLAAYPNVKVKEFADMGEACKAVESKEVFGVVFDAPVLKKFAASNNSLEMAGEIIVPESYGIIAKNGSKDIDQVNISVLRVREDGRYEALAKRWLK